MPYLNILSHLLKAGSGDVSFKTGEYLFQKGEEASCVLLVRSGATHLDGSDEPGLDKRRIWGVKEIFLNIPHAYSLRASDHVQCSSIPREQFLDALRDNPALRIDLLRWLSGELKSD